MCVCVFAWLRMLDIRYSDFGSFIHRLYSDHFGGSTGNILSLQHQRFRPVISVLDLLPSVLGGNCSNLSFFPFW